jgi:four helix bundle protein
MEDIKVIKSEEFAIDIVRLYKELISHRNETVMSKQLLRSGTSVGANIAESRGSESQADFVHKLGISLKEAYESLYWLKLLFRTQYISDEEYKYLMAKCCELIRILRAIVKNKTLTSCTKKDFG